MLRESGELAGDPRPVTHPVKFYEYGDTPLEIISTRQWYLRNGGRDDDRRAEVLARGRELHWVPGHMRRRYEHWVEGLTSDWLISRQRYFGVPIPVWYPLDDDGEPRFDRPLLPAESRLPVDPSADVPEGYAEFQRGHPGGFVADPDVMDTWATSSLTPLIAGGWERDPDLFGRVFPMDLRPQAHEIIRTWLFSTIVRSHLEFGVLPWRDAVISGWILDPDRKKMSKSRGNVVTPMDVLDQYGSDAVRYWAATGRPGADLAFDPNQVRIGRRLATKLLNAAKFVLGLTEQPISDDGTAAAGDTGVAADGRSRSAAGPRSVAAAGSRSVAAAGSRSVAAAGSRSVAAADVTAPLDLAMLAELSTVLTDATAAFEAYDHTGALDATERFFWTFCDDYLELVKERAYGTRGLDGAASARAALTLALSVQLRLFAPFLPYVTEEIWSWWRYGSVHRAPWPAPGELARGGEPAVLAAASEAIRQVRRAKSERKLSMRAEIPLAEVLAPEEDAERVAAVVDDLRAAGRIIRLDIRPGTAPELIVACAF